jgi:hypothetical protein
MPQLGAAGADRPTSQQSLANRAGEASIRSSEEQDRSRHHSAHRGGLELSTHWVGARYGACRSTHGPSVVWLCGLDGVESSLVHEYAPSPRRVYRALKKITEAPYTTKVNNRGKG